MAQITVNEISQNYSYRNVESNFATVALPITSSWGPGFFDPAAYYSGESDDGDGISRMLTDTEWKHFPSTQAGLQSFIATYRGPMTGYRLIHDYSYSQAVTLLCAGYDVLVCRVCPGTLATGKLTQPKGGTINFRAKYPGSFGNNIQVSLRKGSYFDKTQTASNMKKFFWTLTIYVIDDSGVKTSVESFKITFDEESATENVPFYKEISSNFIDIVSVEGTIKTDADAEVPVARDPAYSELQPYVRLGAADDATKGTDYNTELSDYAMDFAKIARMRYTWAENYQLGYANASASTYQYPEAIAQLVRTKPIEEKRRLYAREWILSHIVGPYGTNSDGDLVGGVLDLLKDRLSYAPHHIYGGGFDDQDYTLYESDRTKLTDYIGSESDNTCKLPVSPLHIKLMDVAYGSRCADAYLDIPRCVSRKFVHIEDDINLDREGYAQKLARVTPNNSALDIDGSLFVTHSALFVNWGKFKYSGMSVYHRCPPSFAELLIHKAQLNNQSNAYWWLLPSDRSHNIKIADLDYKVPEKLLHKWQKEDGVGINIICDVPGIGITNWGNSTLYEVPVQTYQALANLSTRWLVNAIKDVVFKVGMTVTWQYNNQKAYDKMYAGTVPILDQMKYAGAIEDYYVRYNADLNAVDHVNANTVVGTIVISVYGVINDINVDLIAIPAGIGLNPEDFAG